MCWANAALAVGTTALNMYAQRSAGGGMMAQDPGVQNRLAEVSRQQYDDYIARFRPHEIEAVYEYLNPEAGMTDRIGRSEEAANEAWDASRGVTSRALADYQVAMDPSQDQTRGRVYRLNRSAGTADTVNRARRTERERHFRRGDELFQTGRGIEGTSSSAFATAASLENSRQNQNQASYANWRQQVANSRSEIINGAATAAYGAVASRGSGG